MASGLWTKFGPIEIGGRIGSIWFLPALFFANLIVQLLLRYIGKPKERYLLAVLLAVFACVLALRVWLPFSILSGMMAAPVVMLGYDLRKKNILERLSLRQAVVCGGIFSLGTLFKITPVLYESAAMRSYLFSMPCALASSACVIYIARKLEKCMVLKWIGMNSMYFMCIHLFELETMGEWFGRVLRVIRLPDCMLSRLGIKLLFITAVTMLILQAKHLVANCRQHTLRRV